jgi:hypothetical protein
VNNYDLLVLYAVRNSRGEWFRAKGYQGRGETWVADMKSAKIYARPGPAKTQVTFFAKKFPELPVPELVELVVTEVRAVDQVARVKKAINEIDAKNRRQRERLKRYYDNEEAVSMSLDKQSTSA